MTVEDVLRGQIADLIDDVTYYKSVIEDLIGYSDTLRAENAKLRELIFDMLVDEERGHNDDGTFYEHVILAKELGVELDA